MTPVELALTALMRAEVAGTLAIGLVLALRGPCRQLIGAQLAYRLWLIPPITAAVAVFPSLADYAEALRAFGGPGRPVSALTGVGVGPLPNAALAIQVWLAGVVFAAALTTLSEWRFRRQAGLGRAGPAVMGVLWPRMVTPADHAQRFDAAERDLIRRHERMHIHRGDPLANLALAAAQALNWFNPLVHAGATCFRLDQELACDAAVIEARPQSRRLYGETLLKAHLSSVGSPLACAWLRGARHPLEVRVAMLGLRPPALSSYLRGAAMVILVGVVAAAGVWTTGPTWTAGRPFTWPVDYGQIGAR